MWYVVQVLGGQEKATLEVVRGLIDENVLAEAFIPQREVMRHQAGEWIKTREILFPGYLFVDAANPERLFGELSRVPTFTRLLGTDGGFVPLSDEEVGLIRALTGDNHVAEVSEGVEEGGSVRILNGPLRDLDATIVKIDRHKRAAFASMHIFGRETIVKLGLEIVRKA